MAINCKCDYEGVSNPKVPRTYFTKLKKSIVLRTSMDYNHLNLWFRITLYCRHRVSWCNGMGCRLSSESVQYLYILPLPVFCVVTDIVFYWMNLYRYLGEIVTGSVPHTILCRHTVSLGQNEIRNDIHQDYTHHYFLFECQTIYCKAQLL